MELPENWSMWSRDRKDGYVKGHVQGMKEANEFWRKALREGKPHYCVKCEVFDHNEEHICTVYDGPPCKTCGKPTIFYSVGAPGYGTGRVCKDNHHEELTPHGELTSADVI
jgi:hypothetical protein